MKEDAAAIRSDIALSNTKAEEKTEIPSNALTRTDQVVQGLQDQIVTYKATTKILMGSMCRMQQQIDELKLHLDKTELNTSKKG